MWETKDVIVHYPMISFDKNETVEYDKATDCVNDKFVKKYDLLSLKEKLSILLTRKKDMILNFFFVEENREIKINDFLNLYSDEKIKKEDINM